MDMLAAALQLALVPGVGPRLWRALVAQFGSPQEVLAASPAALRQVPGVGPRLAETIAAAQQKINVQAELALAAQHGIRLLFWEDPAYPRLLREISDPPVVLYVRGEFAEQDKLAMAIVGSRHATSYGLAQAEALAASLARAGLTIVSGLARGIDQRAHSGALAAGGRTLAVLGSGLLNIYPAEHRRLADEVAQHGALVSELALHAEPLASMFPRRNRLLSGLCLGVIVVEAADRSGALITARHALEQGREVFAVPGRIDSRMSRGCHQLIRDGAVLIRSADDVLEALGPLVEPVATSAGSTLRHPAELALNELERRVLDCIESEPTLVDQIVAASGLEASQVLATLSVLEMRKLISRCGGQFVTRR
ncbi:MAG: DNA-processing protein DprA [Pirellulales bacterium]|nr:DNA-processing protein DprA [Pirellulales bacterium]